MILTRCDVMNIKWATLTVGAIFGFAHIGILGHLLNRPQYPIVNFPDGDYSSFNIKSGRNGYSFEYKANDPKDICRAPAGALQISEVVSQTPRESPLYKAQSVSRRTLEHEVKVQWQVVL